MVIREYQNSDSEKLFELFCDTIYFMNSKDYTEEQLKVWVKENRDLSLWEKSLSENYTLIAEEKDMIIGFGNIREKIFLKNYIMEKEL